MYNISEIEEVAIAEILNPSFATTQQILQDHSIQYKDGKPVISRVDTENGNDSTVVYFNIIGELFHLAVYIDTYPFIQIRSVEIEAGSKVYLWIEKPHNNANINLHFIPTRISPKGFEFGPNKDDADNPQHKISKLLDIIFRDKEKIKEIGSKTYVCLNVAYYGYKNQMWGIHLGTEVLKKLAFLNIDLDVDLYACGKEVQ